jgi:cell division protein FtsL
VSPRSAAAAVARTAAGTIHAPGRTHRPTRPAPARRRSGAATPRGAQPRTRVAAGGAFVGVLDRVLRGPAYIGLVFVLLVGIVFFNVDVLELNKGIAQTDQRAAQLKRENAALTLKVAELGSSERIQRVALEHGLVLPQPGDVRYLRASKSDAGRALRVMTAPDSSSAAAAVQTTVVQTSPPAGTAPGTTQAQTGTPQPVAATTPTTTTAPAQTTPSTTTAPAQTTPAQTTPAQTTPAQTQPAQPQTAAAPATPQGAVAAGE